ncbi:potassium/sodium hyperpolarization-activated cyclic nucleotide-gated channel 4-like isoform X3 [Atheta coriaria]|uniref:potassium/sodium hyperpolarization-activated cyclic nucleotide-gated channel 4-like isoform X3 n=1 Tax=Dalotia coriaria TaxID=877792 RepID=UPI0031F3840B
MAPHSLVIIACTCGIYIVTYIVLRTQFRKFGHICEIQIADSDLTNFQSANPFRRWFNRLRMINETNQRSYSFLRSQKKIMNEHKKLLEYSYVIHPFSIFRTTWDVITCFILLLQMIMIPLDIAFYSVKFEYNMVRSPTFELIRIFTDVLSFVDIIITFFCGYCDLDQNQIVVNPARIAKYYLGRLFVLDLFSSIPFDVILNNYESPNPSESVKEWYFIGHYIGLLKLVRYYTFVMYTARMFDATITEIYYVVHRISIAFLSFILYLHVICCLCIAWNGTQIQYSYELADSPPTIFSYGIDTNTLGKMYTRFFYGACLVVFNAGYGFPVFDHAALVFTTNVWLCSRLLYILALAYFIQLQTAIQSSTQKYVDMLCEVKDYMRHRQIPNFLQNRILSYYDIKFQNCFFQESEILNTVSAQLRQEIIMNTCRKLVEDVSFFKNLPMSLLVRIVSSLSYDIFLTNDVIAKVGTIGNSMYFISNGTVAVYSNHGKELCHLQDGDHFGEIALINRDSIRVASVIAAEVCELYRLDRKDFVKAIMPFPDLYEKIAFVASERKENTNIADEIPNRREPDRTFSSVEHSIDKPRSTRPTLLYSHSTSEKKMRRDTKWQNLLLSFQENNP